MVIDNLSICPQIACLLSVMLAFEYFITQKRKTGYLRLSHVFLKEVLEHEILPSSIAANCQFSSQYHYSEFSSTNCSAANTRVEVYNINYLSLARSTKFRDKNKIIFEAIVLGLIIKHEINLFK